MEMPTHSLNRKAPSDSFNGTDQSERQADSSGLEVKVRQEPGGRASTI